jgi:hypothetical protein
MAKSSTPLPIWKRKLKRPIQMASHASNNPLTCFVTSLFTFFHLNIGIIEMVDFTPKQKWFLLLGRWH